MGLPRMTLLNLLLMFGESKICLLSLGMKQPMIGSWYQEMLANWEVKERI